MIRKKAVSLVLTVLVALAILVSLQAVVVANHDLSVAGSSSQAVLVDNAPTPTPASADSNPSGGGNSGG